LGSLSMSLRSIADNTSDLERAVASGQVKVPAGTSPDQEKQMLLAMANRPIDNSTTFSTGGDVSRFQRRSVPSRAPQMAQASLTQSLAIAKAAAPAVPTGPVVKIVRGNDVTVVPVGAR
jgi:pilus assembly protein CpaB